MRHEVRVLCGESAVQAVVNNAGLERIGLARRVCEELGDDARSVLEDDALEQSRDGVIRGAGTKARARVRGLDGCNQGVYNLVHVLVHKVATVLHADTKTEEGSLAKSVVGSIRVLKEVGNRLVDELCGTRTTVLDDIVQEEETNSLEGRCDTVGLLAEGSVEKAVGHGKNMFCKGLKSSLTMGLDKEADALREGIHNLMVVGVLPPRLTAGALARTLHEGNEGLDGLGDHLSMHVENGGEALTGVVIGAHAVNVGIRESTALEGSTEDLSDLVSSGGEKERALVLILIHLLAHLLVVLTLLILALGLNKTVNEAVHAAGECILEDILRKLTALLVDLNRGLLKPLAHGANQAAETVDGVELNIRGGNVSVKKLNKEACKISEPGHKLGAEVCDESLDKLNDLLLLLDLVGVDAENTLLGHNVLLTLGVLSLLVLVVFLLKLIELGIIRGVVVRHAGPLNEARHHLAEDMLVHGLSHAHADVGGKAGDLSVAVRVALAPLGVHVADNKLHEVACIRHELGSTNSHTHEGHALHSQTKEVVLLLIPCGALGGHLAHVLMSCHLGLGLRYGLLLHCVDLLHKRHEGVIKRNEVLAKRLSNGSNSLKAGSHDIGNIDGTIKVDKAVLLGLCLLKGAGGLHKMVETLKHGLGSVLEKVSTLTILGARAIVCDGECTLAGKSPLCRGPGLRCLEGLDNGVEQHGAEELLNVITLSSVVKASLVRVLVILVQRRYIRVHKQERAEGVESNMAYTHLGARVVDERHEALEHRLKAFVEKLTRGVSERVEGRDTGTLTAPVPGLGKKLVDHGEELGHREILSEVLDQDVQRTEAVVVECVLICGSLDLGKVILVFVLIGVKGQADARLEKAIDQALVTLNREGKLHGHLQADLHALLLHILRSVVRGGAAKLQHCLHELLCHVTLVDQARLVVDHLNDRLAPLEQEFLAAADLCHHVECSWDDALEVLSVGLINKCQEACSSRYSCYANGGAVVRRGDHHLDQEVTELEGSLVSLGLGRHGLHDLLDGHHSHVCSGAVVARDGAHLGQASEESGPGVVSLLVVAHACDLSHDLTDLALGLGRGCALEALEKHIAEVLLLGLRERLPPLLTGLLAQELAAEEHSAKLAQSGVRAHEHKLQEVVHR
mmetsp:Transcript_2091/g.4782  ORF Transcript_2091/g.4782 Transcript_2091/m.4782 type:complete len:1136 (+) Transcript_2091:571-3978(+)